MLGLHGDNSELRTDQLTQYLFGGIEFNAHGHNDGISICKAQNYEKSDLIEVVNNHINLNNSLASMRINHS